MDKISKALKKFSAKEKKFVKVILEKIKKSDFKNLNIRKLKARQDIYRIKKANIRIIYKIKNKRIIVLTVEKRSDNTYKF